MRSVVVGVEQVFVGQTTQFTATATMSDDAKRDVTQEAQWVSADEAIATVTASGGVSGMSQGTVNITATYLGLSGTAHVVVYGTTTYTVSGTVTDGTSGGVLPRIVVSATAGSAAAKSSETDSGGRYAISGLPAGSMVLSASAVGYVTATRLITMPQDSRVDFVLARVSSSPSPPAPTPSPSPPAPPVPVALNITGPPLVAGGPPQQLVATAAFSDGSKQNVTLQTAWGTSNPSVATIGMATGVVTPIAPGQADITALYHALAAHLAVVVSPSPITTFTISGRVTDATDGSGVSGVTIRATDAQHAGKVAMSDVIGSYSLTGMTPGSITLSATAPIGYAPVEKTLTVTTDTRIDFILPRTASSPHPNIAGTWAGRILWSRDASTVEFTFSQTEGHITGTWRMPYFDLRGTIDAVIGSDRRMSGRLTFTTPDIPPSQKSCTDSGDIIYGNMDATERYLTLNVPFSGACDSIDFVFELDRTCRLATEFILSCASP